MIHIQSRALAFIALFFLGLTKARDSCLAPKFWGGTDISHDQIPVAQALDLLAPHFGDRVAKDTILSRIEDARLSLYADLAIQEADLGEPILDPDFWRSDQFFRRLPRQAESCWCSVADQPVPLPEGSLSRGRNWEIDPSETSWSDGFFLARKPATFKPRLKMKRLLKVAADRAETPHTVTPPNPKVRLIVVGLHLLESEIAGLLPSSNRIPTIAPESESGAERSSKDDASRKSVSLDMTDDPDGRYFPGEDEPIMKELVQLIHDGKFKDYVRKKGYSFNLPGIRRAYEKKLLEAEMRVPSLSTSRRRARSLFDIYSQRKKL